MVVWRTRLDVLSLVVAAVSWAAAILFALTSSLVLLAGITAMESFDPRRTLTR